MTPNAFLPGESLYFGGFVLALRTNPGRILPSMPFTLQWFTGVNGQRFNLAPQDGDRAAIAFVMSPPYGAMVNNEWRIMPGTGATTDTGWSLDNNTRTQLFTFADYGPIVGQQWQGLLIDSGFGTVYSLGVYTFRFQPRIR